MRAFVALFLSALIALSGVILADARGASRDLGTEIVICSGVEMVTITIGPDGQPIEKFEVCPDGTSIFAAAFTFPPMPLPSFRFLGEVDGAPVTGGVARAELTPSARGPPALI